MDDDGTFKKFNHKKDITRELYYNVYCSDVAEMIQMLPKEYTLLIADIPYIFRIVGSSYNDEPFRFKQLEKMVEDFAKLTCHRYDNSYVKIWTLHVLYIVKCYILTNTFKYMVIVSISW